MSSRGPMMFCGVVLNCTATRLPFKSSTLAKDEIRRSDERVAELEQRLREDDLRPHEVAVAVGQANHRVALFGEHGRAHGTLAEIGAVPDICHRPPEASAERLADLEIEAGLRRIVARERQVGRIRAQAQRPWAAAGASCASVRGRLAQDPAQRRGRESRKRRRNDLNRISLSLPPRWLSSTENTNSAPPSGAAASHLLADVAEEGRQRSRAPDHDGDILLAVDRVGDRSGADAGAEILLPELLAVLASMAWKSPCRLPAEHEIAGRRQRAAVERQVFLDAPDLLLGLTGSQAISSPR